MPFYKKNIIIGGEGGGSNHSHINKVVLDGITQAKVEEWDETKGIINGIENVLYKEVDVLNSVNPDTITTLENFSLTKISDTKYTIESRNDFKLFCIPVNEGERYNLYLKTFLNQYNCLGIVYSTTTEIPTKWNNNNAKECLSMSIYNPYFTATSTAAWKQLRGDVDVPNGCKMIIICAGSTQTIGESIKIYTKEEAINFISLNDENNTLDKVLIRKSVFPIEDLPTITTGTIQENTTKVKNSKKAYFWSFNKNGSMEARLKFYCEENDTVGIWLWCNFNQLDYTNNIDGTIRITVGEKAAIVINTAYSFKNGWNYLELGTFKKGLNDVPIVFNYSLVRGNYILGIDSIELNYVPYKKPKILLSFDKMSESLYTVRYPLLKSYGFPATVCNVAWLTEEQRLNLFADGWDWAIYGNGGLNDLGMERPSFETGTEEEWITFFKMVINRYEEVGLFNPISYFSPSNRGSETLMNAEKKVGFRMSRIACNGNEKTGYFDRDSFFIYTLGVGGTDTSEGINKQIDDAISQNKSLCIFTHDIEEVLTDNMNCSRDVYIGILEHLKDLVESDKCDVVTFRQFYQYCEPNDYAELMAIRYEKEKKYILGKLSQ